MFFYYYNNAAYSRASLLLSIVKQQFVPGNSNNEISAVHVPCSVFKILLRRQVFVEKLQDVEFYLACCNI